jgi:aquaporin Z
MHKYLTELIGTFFLVLTIGLTVLGGSPLAPLAIGAALMVMVYMGGHVSGGHYNPAISLAVFLRGALKGGDLLPYVLFQLVGALLASGVVYRVMGHTFAPAPAAGTSSMAAFTVELLFTFALCLVWLNVATAQQTAGNSFYGLAIGFTVVAALFAGGPISGGAFNPAVGAGPLLLRSLIGESGIQNLWLYVAGPLLGAVVAALVFQRQEQAA